ncbi:Holliday junction ATP-dependent DNA helicase RuvA [Phocoenobacter uteri]|uniref:Holliday junction branch migration complex subunit RuvA n=1 Tax=Phocoenobacter uteri TaxID=146806 RepID=A0A379CBX4_9PAST|nr:Holliday junction branch migration protein RuvA [Phocoenobacter uteri]MDG6881747.1 Holliday junction DNA helicase RuvA [Phocoenobacter uteri]SUB59783.1 Holliday junction ATP-dependent DNA helicase RuvA [Phocoenobacter uteri]
MIGRLHGKIIEKTPPEIVLDVQGVGYELLLPMTSFYNLPNVGEETTLFTHLSIREDAHLLFGFSEKIDRTLFRDLIKTNGVGPKLALAILSAMSVYDFATAIENEDVVKLTKIPGIGKKTAERLLVELKGKFKSVAQTDFFMEQSSHQTAQINTPNPTDEAKEALISLGYKATEIEKMLKHITQKDLSSEEIIREALKRSL